MENFFSLLRKNVLDRRRGDVRQDPCIAIITCIERTHHRVDARRLARLACGEFETI